MADPSAAAPRGPEPVDPDELVERLFCRRDSPHGVWTKLGAAHVTVDDLLVRAVLHRPGDEYDRYDVSIFLGVRGLAGELWEQEARALLRIEALDHPSLPSIRQARHDADENVAFTFTRQIPGEPVTFDELFAWSRANPLDAFEQFTLLVDALARLHGVQLLHRNLGLGALHATERDGAVTLAIDHFEMSALIGNILRDVLGGQRETRRRSLRRALTTPPAGTRRAHHLAYLPPESHAFFFDERPAALVDYISTDMFGLGVLGFELFCGPVGSMFPDRIGEIDGADESRVPHALASLHVAMRLHLRTDRTLPAPLRDALVDMLATRPESRSTAFEAARALERDWEAVRGCWQAESDRLPYLVAFMPEDSVQTIYVDRSWISESPQTPAGRDQLKAFFARELAQAELVRSPTGALGYATGSSETLEEAQWVLIGERAVWFCAYVYQGRSSTTTFDNVLVIKYLKEKEFAHELVALRPRRRVDRIDLMSFRPGQDVEEQRRGRPSWRPLTDSVMVGRQRTADELAFLRSLDFLIDFQRTELDARQYPFRRAGTTDAGEVLIEHDKRRDEEWRHSRPMLSAFAADEKRRPPMGNFFADLDDESEYVELEVIEGSAGRPSFGSHQRFSVDFVERVDANAVRVRCRGGAPVPATGWIRPATDAGSAPQLARQARARIALEHQPGLIRSLRRPSSVDIARGRWDQLPLQVAELEGEAPARVRDMLSQYPIYALQGPPGTGKTTVATLAVKTFLENEPAARVLVSAQSNFALDNLGQRLLKSLGDDVIVLREAPPDREDDVVRDPLVRRHCLDRLTTDVTERVRRHLTAVLAGRPPGDSGHVPDDDAAPVTNAQRAVAEGLLKLVGSNQIELADRIRAGASVILATCSYAGALRDGGQRSAELLDWIVVEEAAKAWPTELLVPLVLGVRWTLIGDHRQLGAHRSDYAIRFLESLANSNVEEMKILHQERANHLRCLELFGSMFEPPAGSTTVDGSALGRLDLQFRMNRAIAEPVSRTFYRAEPERKDEYGLPVGFLGTHASANVPLDLMSPAGLRGRPLVWLDTSRRAECVDEPRWINRTEVGIIDRLVDRIRPVPEGDDRLAILSPYRAQVVELERRGNLRKRTHTVHSFQGREADQVIVSLVRTKTQREGGGPEAHVGHVGDPQLANVLLSRARRQLVIVGNLTHFENHGGPVWASVCAAVRTFGEIIDASDTEEW